MTFAPAHRTRAPRLAASLMTATCAAVAAIAAAPLLAAPAATSLAAHAIHNASQDTARDVEQDQLSAERRAAHLASFDEVWQTVLDRHWDPELGGVDWHGARERLRPRMESVSSDDEALLILTELLDTLKLSHYNVFPSSTYAGDVAGPRGDAVAGLTLRLLDGDPVVVHVEPNGAAHAANVRTGWIVRSVDGRPIKPFVDRIETQARASKQRPGVMSSMAAEMMMTGQEGEELPVIFEDGDGEQIERTLTLRPSPDPVFGFGNLPEMPLRIRFKVLDERVGMFSFSSFLDPMRLMPELEAAIEASRDLDGFIIDLRGNIGGIVMLCNGVTGWLLREPTAELGQLEMRGTTLKLVANRRPRPLALPVAVLIDERSISAAEILAGGLRDIGRARLFGTVTAGMSLPSNIVRLPNGDGFLHAIANYRSASGRILEHNGVEPHVLAPHTRQSLLAGRDEARDRAVAWLIEEAASAASSSSGAADSQE